MRYDPGTLTGEQITSKLNFAAKLVASREGNQLPEPLHSEKNALHREQLRRVKCIYGDGI